MSEEKRRLQKTALAVTRWVGSPQSIVVHTILFAGSFAAAFSGLVSFDRMLLILTTVVSLEAIYLAIFIQMTINVQSEIIEEVEQDIDEIQDDIDEIQEDVEEMQEDVGEMQEDVEEMSEEDKAEEVREAADRAALEELRSGLAKLMESVDKLQK